MVETDKGRLRAELGAARRLRSAADLEKARAAIRAHVLAAVVDRGWDCVAAYEPLRTEPGSIELLAALHAAGIRVLVPVTLPERDLDWTHWSASGHGPQLGMDAVGDAALVLVPALAVALDGTRLGRGGGSYDRALARSAPGAQVAALVFEHEVRARLPRDAWDLPVHAAVTPVGWVALAG